MKYEPIMSIDMRIEMEKDKSFLMGWIVGSICASAMILPAFWMLGIGP